MKPENTTDDSCFVSEATRAFERATGITSVPSKKVAVGDRDFLKFTVGRNSPLYIYALHETKKSLSSENPFSGAVGIETKKAKDFASSLEAIALHSLLTRWTKEISEDSSARGYAVPYIPFHRHEDIQLAQPASHIVRGRRGVGKSTLIRRAVELVADTKAMAVVLDMQAYATLSGDELTREVLYDVCRGLALSGDALRCEREATAQLRTLADKISKKALSLASAPVTIKRAIGQITRAQNNHAFVFLDDYHLIDSSQQPHLLHTLNGSLKGANGWLKVAGLSTLLNHYDPRSRHGLQVPGNAQYISLDLTLANPEAAESHLKAILLSFSCRGWL